VSLTHNCWKGVLTGQQNSRKKSLKSRQHNCIYTKSYINRSVNIRNTNICISQSCVTFNKNITTLCSEAASLLAQIGDSVGEFDVQTPAREAGILVPGNGGLLEVQGSKNQFRCPHAQRASTIIPTTSPRTTHKRNAYLN
jgi:hypothetical protein